MATIAYENIEKIMFTSNYKSLAIKIFDKCCHFQIFPLTWIMTCSKFSLLNFVKMLNEFLNKFQLSFLIYSIYILGQKTFEPLNYRHLEEFQASICYSFALELICI